MIPTLIPTGLRALNLPFAVFSICLMLSLISSGGAPLHAEVVNRIVLRINDRIATLADFELRKEEARGEIERRVQDPVERERQLAQLPESAFRDMFEEMLIQSRADQLSVDVEEKDIDASVLQMRESFGIQNDEQFRAALAQTGLTEAELRDQLRKNRRMQEVVGREVQGKIRLEEEDLRRYFGANQERFRVPEQIQLREVVVLSEATPDPAARLALAQEIRAAIAAIPAGSTSQAIDEIVAPYQTSGRTSGVIDLGWISKPDLDAAIANVAWDLAPGAVGEPTEGRGGLHIPQLVERRASYIRPFSEVSQEIESIERSRLFREKFAQYEQQLIKDSLIVENPPAEAKGFRRLLGEAPIDKLEAADAPAREVVPETAQPVTPPTGG